MIGDPEEDEEDIWHMIQPALYVGNMFIGFVINDIIWNMLLIQ